MDMARLRPRLLALVLALLMTTTTLVALSGTASAADEVDQISSAVETAPPIIGEDVAVPRPLPGGSTAVADDGTTVTSPARADEAVTLDLASGLTVEVDLPTASARNDQASIGDVSNEGLVIYPRVQEATAAAVQTTEEGTVRLLTVLSGPQAPQEFRYDFTVPSGTSWVPTAEGGLALVDQHGDGLPLTIDPAWATDADGQELPTHFRVEGTTIVQSVDHRDAVYPVVADPAVRNVCGTVTCSLYFSRATTRQMVTPTGVAAVLLNFVPVAGPVLAASAAIIAIKASEAAGLNACLRIRYLKYYPYTIVGLYSDTSGYCTNT